MDLTSFFAIELGFYFLILHPLFPKAGLLESDDKAEEHDHAVTDLCTVLDGLLVAVAIQRQDYHYSILSFLTGRILFGFLTSLFDNAVVCKE